VNLGIPAEKGFRQFCAGTGQQLWSRIPEANWTTPAFESMSLMDESHVRTAKSDA
jgi:hypothetical protein